MYLQNSDIKQLQALQRQLTINFHNITRQNLRSYFEEINELQRELDYYKQSVNSNKLFKEAKIPLVTFFKDYENFITFFKANSKNAIITKMAVFKSLSKYELESFENSFSHIANKNANCEENLLQLYLIINEIFKSSNKALLKNLSHINELEHKISDNIQKKNKIDERIKNILEALTKLQEILMILNDKTDKYINHMMLIPSFAKLRGS